MANQRRKFLIDTDAGVDDAQAILMALSQPNIDVVAITSTHGNTTAHQVCKNVLRTLKVVDRLDVPVYRGAEKSLVGTQGDSSFYHGKDGLGDVPDPDPVEEALIMSEHAVTAMLSMSKKYKGELTLVAIGPLTNVALAIRLDPEFGKRLKDCYIMGGNYEGKGNITPSAEFNFHTDPEAAQVVLNELGCPITMACWELCLKHSFPWNEHEQLRSQLMTTKNIFLTSLQQQSISGVKRRGRKGWVHCDEIAVALAIDHNILKQGRKTFATVELIGDKTRGQMIIDDRINCTQNENVTIATEIEKELFLKYLKHAAH